MMSCSARRFTAMLSAFGDILIHLLTRANDAGAAVCAWARASLSKTKRMAHPTRFERVTFAFGGQEPTSHDNPISSSAILLAIRVPSRAFSTFHLEMGAKQMILLEGILTNFFKCALKSLNNQADLDSAIRRFDPSRPSHTLTRPKIVVNLYAKSLHFPRISAIGIGLQKPKNRQLWRESPKVSSPNRRNSHFWETSRGDGFDHTAPKDWQVNPGICSPKDISRFEIRRIEAKH